MNNRSVEYWQEKAMKCYEAAAEHRTNGDDARAQMAEEAYRIAVSQALTLGSKAFYLQEAR